MGIGTLKRLLSTRVLQELGYRLVSEQTAVAAAEEGYLRHRSHAKAVEGSVQRPAREAQGHLT